MEVLHEQICLTLPFLLYMTGSAINKAECAVALTVQID